MVEPIETLLDEVRLLWHTISQAGERLHAKEPVTLGMRGVLEFLAREGPTAVPRIARSRNVSRQHIQGLVNALTQLGLAAVLDNPDHKRSALVRLTPSGQRLLERMKCRERRYFDEMGLGVRPGALLAAARTLRAVRTAVGGRR